MKTGRLIATLALVFIAMNKLFAQGISCQSHFTYTYNPGLSEPEQDIYLFSDSSTGEDSSTTFSWTFGTGDFSGLQNPTFTYEPDDSGFEAVCLTIHNTDNGCTSTYCDTIRVDNLCIGARYNYTMQGNTGLFVASICGQYDSINWNFGDGTSATGTDSIAHTFPGGVDSFNVCLHVFLTSECEHLYPCKANECQTVYVYPTGVANLALPEKRLKIYPDPASNYITVGVGDIKFPAQLVITDVADNVVLHSAIDSGIQQVKINDLQAGIYFVQITNGLKKSMIGRFVRQ